MSLELFLHHFTIPHEKPVCTSNFLAKPPGRTGGELTAIQFDLHAFATQAIAQHPTTDPRPLYLVIMAH